MKRNIALLLVVIALALAGAWYGLAVDPAPTPRAEPAAEEGPIAVTNDTPDHEVIAPARPATPEPAPGEQAAPAQRAAAPAPAEPAAPMTELESLEARWRELRRQGHWNEAAPLWEEIKRLRAARAKPTGEYTEEELKWVGLPAPGPDPIEPKGGYAPAEPWIPPRKDMLPGPLPRGSAERVPAEKLGVLKITLTCATLDPANYRIWIRLFDESGKLIEVLDASADAAGVVVFGCVPVRAKTFEVYGRVFETSTRESCNVRVGEETDWGRLNLVAKK